MATTKKAAAEVVATEVAKAETLVETLTVKAEKLAEEVTTKAEKLVEDVTAKAEKLAEEATTATNELVQKVQAESNSLVEKVKTLVAQLQTSISAESLTELGNEATALIKEIQTTGYQALKSDYALLRSTIVSNFETLQANSSLKTFATELLAKLPSKKAA
jgi:polyhydroxyalkanoate synthesis regulator phasin